jgi:hypothetical protein
VFKKCAVFLDKKIRVKIGKDRLVLPQAPFSRVFEDQGQVEICSEAWFDLAASGIKSRSIQIQDLIPDTELLPN